MSNNLRCQGELQEVKLENLWIRQNVLELSCPVQQLGHVEQRSRFLTHAGC